MSCYSKEKPERNDYSNICKSHSARSDRAELYRICPSKLSKRELEDLYFSLLENNLDLKRTINGQDDKIRGLSTKLQRMTAAQRVLQTKEMKECCVGTKSVVSEQKESLADLKRANQRMAERIRMLNMRLCSAKQFYKKAPTLSAPRYIRCATVSTPKKHSCFDKKSDPVLKLSTSCQYIDRDAVSMRSAQTETRDLEKQNEDTPCDENKCKSLMEELKMKIVNLQEELSQVHEEYSARIGRLEAEVAGARRETGRVAGERRACAHEAQQAASRNSDLLSTLRTTEGKCAEVSAQLSIQKRKVAELETRLKAASLTNRVNKTIQDHTTPKNKTNAPSQDTKHDESQNVNVGECLCNFPTKVTDENAAIKCSNSADCSCPSQEEEPIVTTSNKSYLGNVSSIQSNSSKTTPSRAMPPTDTKCISCTPSEWNESEFVQSTPTKAELFESAPTKDSKCENCACSMRCEGESPESSSIKAATYSPPKVADTRGSPRAYNEDGKTSKASDDSGYIDANRSQETPDDAGLNKLNKELIKKILELQSQVDSMKIAGACELPGAKQYKLSENDRSSLSGVILSPTKSAVEKPETTSENRTDAVESSQPEVSAAKSPTSETGPDKQLFNMTQNCEMNKPDVQPAIKIDSIEDTAMKAIDEAIRKQNGAVEERRLSKSNGKKSSNGRINRHRSSNNTKLVPYVLEMSTAEERKSEVDFPWKTELAPDPLNIPTTIQRAPELDLDNGKLAVSDYKQQNKGELVPTKLEDPTIAENRLDIEVATPKLSTNGDRVPNKTELFGFFDQPQVQAEERNLSQNDERVPIKMTNLPGNMKAPVTEDVPVNTGSGKLTDLRRISHQEPTTSKEECQSCLACAYESECASRSYISKMEQAKNNGHSTKTVQAMKGDQHNSLQIPGPIPTTNTNNKDWKKNMFRRISTDRRRDSKSKDKPENQNKLPTKESMEKASANIREKLKESYKTTSGPLNLPDVPVLHTDKETQMTEETSVMHDDSRKNYFNGSKDSINMDDKRFNPVHDPVMKDSAAPARDISMHNFYSRSDNFIQTLHRNQDQGTQMEERIDQTPQGQKSQEQTVLTNNNVGCHRPSVSEGRQRDVSVYRRSSGTLCFRTLPADGPPKDCRCEQQRDGRCVGKLKDKGTQALVPDVKTLPPPNQQRRWSLTSEQGTYTMGSKQNRSTSPDNTDFEMSYMSDLPFEKDEKRPGKIRALSPGEDKMTTTYTDSYCSPATNYSLSEGEVPTTSARKIAYDNDREKTISAKSGQDTVPAQSMEAALQAISDELARCKNLLTSQRPTEETRAQQQDNIWVDDDLQSPAQQSCQSQTSAPESSRPIALRRGVATQSIGDVYAPKCIFTLHIGTVVLSDEAVQNSHNKSLLLMWKFYDQNVAMTRMRAGRVVLFDFSTEYDIKITDDFLRYLKHEELPIVICELDKENEPFATCSLPLRDALLHTNRRADMSLALEAGPQMVRARAQHQATADALDGRDEMGVIDLWCMLRADANMLPGINLAISQPPPSSPAIKRQHSRVMQQVLDDDHSNEGADLDLTLEARNATAVSGAEKTGKNVCQDVEFARTSHHWSKPLTLRSTPNTSKAEDTYDASKYPAVRSRSNSATLTAGPEPASPGPASLGPASPALPSAFIQRHCISDDPVCVPEHDGSKIIINEVKAKIKTPNDMKQALERSSFQSELTRTKQDEEITSQAHSSLGSSRSIFARLQQRRWSPRSEQQRRDSNQRSMVPQSVKRVSKNSMETPLKIKERDETSESEIYRKYENISKLIGSNRAELKKSVTIVPKYIEPVLDEPQRLTPSQDTITPETYEEEPELNIQRLDITILWLALNEECEAMVDPHVQRVFVAYSFLGRSGADLETPVSLPKPKHYVDKCYFNFKKTFELEDSDLPALGHMARCRTGSKVSENEKDCIIFTVVSEPPEDPLGLENCEDIGYAYLYLGDLLAYSAGSASYTEVVPVRAAGGAAVCGVLAVRLDGLDVVRRCLLLASSQRDLADWSMH